MIELRARIADKHPIKLVSGCPALHVELSPAMRVSWYIIPD